MIDFLKFPWQKGDKPIFTNDQGWEWYKDEETTGWAHRGDHNEIALKNIQGVFLKRGEQITRALYDTDLKQLIYDNTSLEAIACHIDMLKLIKHFK